MKKSALLLVMMFLVSTSTFGQLMVSAGANAYLGQDGPMIGAGASADFGFSGCFTGSDAERTVLGFGLEWFYETTTYTKTPGNGFVVPFTIKERVILAGDFAVDFGFGAAMVIMDLDMLDYSGTSYYVSSELGGAVFAEAGLVYLFPKSRIVLFADIRGGASFIGDGTYPFFGVLVHIGYIFETPKTEDDYYAY
jgi:hypothetical protein